MKVYSTEITGYICSVCGDDTKANTYQAICNDYTMPTCSDCMATDLAEIRVEEGKEAFEKAVKSLKNFPLDYLPFEYQLESDSYSAKAEKGDEKRKYQH